MIRAACNKTKISVLKHTTMLLYGFMSTSGMIQIVYQHLVLKCSNTNMLIGAALWCFFSNDCVQGQEFTTLQFQLIQMLCQA